MSEAWNFIKKETLAQVFSCEFCKIFKNFLFTEHLWATASAPMKKLIKSVVCAMELKETHIQKMLYHALGQHRIQSGKWNSQSGALDHLQNVKTIYLLKKLSNSFKNKDDDKPVTIVAIDDMMTKMKIQENSEKCRCFI